MPKFDLVLTADWHLRIASPICRIDNYSEEQKRKVKWILNSFDMPIIIAGDIFHRWNCQHEIISWIVHKFLKKRGITAIPGNHDVQAGKYKELNNTAYGILESSKSITTSSAIYNNNRKILILHEYTFLEKERPHWAIKQRSAEQILKQHPEYDLIVIGDNHQSFKAKSKNGKRILVNPGSLMRTTADQIDFKPRVALWDSKTNSTEWKYIPIKTDVINREHIDTKKAKEDKEKAILAFVERLKKDVEFGFEYAENMKRFLSENQTPTEIEELLWKAMN